MRSRTYRLVLTAVLTALSLGAFVLENLLPAIPLPGAKIGLANLFSLFALFAVGWPAALAVVAVRVVLGCVITGNIGAIPYALSAGVVSMALGILLSRLVPRVSVVAVGIAMAVAHNITQTAVYCLVVQNTGMMAYLPYLMGWGSLSGAIVGVLTWALLRYMPKPIVDKLSDRIGRQERIQQPLPSQPNQSDTQQ